MFPLVSAYPLKKCAPPPAVDEAEILYEDGDYEIGTSLNNPILDGDAIACAV